MLTHPPAVGRTIHRTGSTAIVIAAASLVVILIAAAAWLLSGRSNSPVSQDAGLPVAEQFLRHIREGAASEAWAATTAEFKSAEGLESFLRSVKSRTYLQEELPFVSMTIVEMNGHPRGEFRFQSKSGKTVTVVVGAEADDWKVDWWTAE